MRRRLESLLPLFVLTGFIAAAVLAGLLLNSAAERGVRALEDSIDAEVQAIAGSQNQRFINTFSGAAGLSNPADPFRLVEGSPEDLAELEDLLQLLPDVRSGFYLLDAADTITQGVQLTDDSVGEEFSWPGYDSLSASPTFAQGVGGVLPVSDGLTTEEPVVAFILPILDPATRTRRGAFVFESVVASDSDFNKEIGSLRRGETGEYLFYDNAGAVIGSNDASLLGEQLSDSRLLEAPVGVHRFGDRLVVLADVPAAGWRVAFRQDIDEFEHPLSGPLESAGLVLIVALLAAGGLLTVVLLRRLQAARSEQERLRHLSEAQQELISIVSHELRTPVAGVLGFLETTIDHWDTMEDGDRLNAVTRAMANAKRLQAMTRDVLDTQSGEAGGLVYVREPLDLTALVEVAVEAAGALAPDRTFEVSVPDEPVWVEGDVDRLHQVLANLLDNAQKSSPAVEPIAIEVDGDEESVEISIRDHGAGIAEESLERIFDKFVRERGDSVSGTGLGLYIARQVVSAHGGRIWAESEAGSGATFHVSLPRHAVGDIPDPKLS